MNGRIEPYLARRRRAIVVDLVWEHYRGVVPDVVPFGEKLELADKVGCAVSGLHGVISDLRRLGSPKAVKAWRSDYCARYRAAAR